MLTNNSLLTSKVVGPTTGGTSEGFRFQKLAEKAESAEAADDDVGVNSFSNPNYENPEVGTRSETATAPAPPPTVFGKLVSVEEKEEETEAGSDVKGDQCDEANEEDEQEVRVLGTESVPTHCVSVPFSGSQGSRVC